jgi:hypothetical protein
MSAAPNPDTARRTLTQNYRPLLDTKPLFIETKSESVRAPGFGGARGSAARAALGQTNTD